MILPPPKACQCIKKLFAQIGSPGKDAEVARRKLQKLLAEHGLTWNDLPRILNGIEPENVDESGNSGTTAGAGEPEVLSLVLRLIAEHIAATPDEHMAIALWILHAWIFDRFSVTPRLALQSPVRGCGKTVLLSLIELLVPEGNRTDNVSAAAIYPQLELRPRTVMLVDEADDGMWHEWRGVRDDRGPRKLSQAELSRLLRPFGVRPKTVWPVRRRFGDKSSRGYLRSQFEAAWARYCARDDTPTQSSKIIRLPRR